MDINVVKKYFKYNYLVIPKNKPENSDSEIKRPRKSNFFSLS